MENDHRKYLWSNLHERMLPTQQGWTLNILISSRTRIQLSRRGLSSSLTDLSKKASTYNVLFISPRKHNMGSHQKRLKEVRLMSTHNIRFLWNKKISMCLYFFCGETEKYQCELNQSRNALKGHRCPRLKNFNANCWSQMDRDGWTDRANTICPFFQWLGHNKNRKR